MEASLQLHGVTLTPHLLRLKPSSKIAHSLFNYSKSLPSFPFSPTSYHILIDLLAKVRQFDHAWQLIIEMDQRNLSPTPITFLILIRRLISAGLTRQAIRAFDDIEAFSQTKTNNEDFCYLLDTLCKYGFVKVAAEVFNKKKQGFLPDTKMYTILIYGWCKIGRIEWDL